MEPKAIDLLERSLPRSGRVGIVGVGRLGTEVRDFIVKLGLEPVLCDPPRNLEEAEELGEHFFDLWGNGMGGCGLSNEGMEVFLPLEALTKADAIVLSVPLTSDGPFSTLGMISRDFLRQCRSDMRVICLCDKAVIAEGSQGDGRIVYA